MRSHRQASSFSVDELVAFTWNAANSLVNSSSFGNACETRNLGDSSSGVCHAVLCGNRDAENSAGVSPAHPDGFLRTPPSFG
jgi:hypothetical protein